jgi:hypothetical protein
VNKNQIKAAVATVAAIAVLWLISSTVSDNNCSSQDDVLRRWHALRTNLERGKQPNPVNDELFRHTIEWAMFENGTGDHAKACQRLDEAGALIR